MPCIKSPIVLLTFLIGWAVSSQLLWSQEPQVGGLPSVLPKIPVADPVPVDDPSGANSFIDSLKGNDAAIEVLLGQGRILAVGQPLADENGSSLVAIGDPSVVEFEILPNPRMIRLLGVRPGVTDLTVILADGQTHSFEVHVVYDLTLLRARLQQMFPTAAIRLGQIREHIVVDGLARSPSQVLQITNTVSAFLASVSGTSSGGSVVQTDSVQDADPTTSAPRTGVALPEERGASAAITVRGPRVINLMKVPKLQQVMLKVQIAELNRTALREIGADLAAATSGGSIIGTQIGGATVNALSTLGLGGVAGLATQRTGTNSTAFGIFPQGDFDFIFRALRQNRLVRILAEPNLVAMSGHNANFLAGGEFPVPVAQAVGLGVTPTIQFKEFGVRLNFTPYVLDDGRIRLSVSPEVSRPEPTLGTTLVVNGTPVPGVTTRRAETTVEMEQGHTLAMAGLLQVELQAGTNRIPGLGDLPYLGPFFSNTTDQRVERELLVLVTPYLVEPMRCDEVPPLPGSEIEDPTDYELYFLNRFEGRTGRRFRSTIEYDPFCHDSVFEYERCNIQGVVGFSTFEEE